MATAATSIGYLCFVEFVLFIRGRGRRLLLLAWAAGGQARPSSSWPPPSLLCLTVLRAPLPCSRSFPLVCIPASGDPLWSAPLLSVRLGSDRSSGCAFWLHSRCSVPRSWCSLRARDCTSGSSRRTKGVGGRAGEGRTTRKTAAGALPPLLPATATVSRRPRSAREMLYSLLHRHALPLFLSDLFPSSPSTEQADRRIYRQIHKQRCLLHRFVPCPVSWGKGLWNTTLRRLLPRNTRK